jgi:hypothetical protein
MKTTSVRGLAVGALAGAILATAARTAAAADEPSPSGVPPTDRPPLPEPIFTESTTDIDGYEPGEIEFDANGATMAARRGGARVLQATFEVEWKIWSRLGVRLEPGFSRARDELTTAAATATSTSFHDAFGFRAAAAWSLLHDFPRDLHVQIEASQRFADDAPGASRTEPGEAPLPFSADLKAAIRWADWTLRTSVGAEAGGTPAHAPFRAQAAILRPLTSEMRFGFFGLEMDADWGRPDPVILAPNVWADVTPIGLPFRMGVAIPIVVGAPDTVPAMGIYLRLLFLTSREASMETPAR